MNSWGLNPMRLLPLVMWLGMAVAGAESKSPPVNPLTDAECAEFGQRLERHLAAGDAGFYANAFNLDAVLDRALAGRRELQEDLKGKREVLKQSFSDAIPARANTIRSLKYLRVTRVNGEPRLLCRVQMTQGGLTYLEPILGRGAEGEAGILDEFNFTKGEALSETCKRMLIPLLAEDQRSFVDRLFNGQAELVKYLPQWSAMAKLNAKGKPRQILAVYAELPPSLQKEKFVLVGQLQAAAQADEKSYLAALELWRRTYPNDASAELLSIDFFLGRKQFTKAMDSVDRLDKAIGGDPYLDYQRSVLFELMGDEARAKAASNRAMEREPTLLEPYFFMLRSLSKERNYVAAISLLARLQAASSLSSKQLAGILEPERNFAVLVNSEEYQAWREGRTNLANSRLLLTGQAQNAKPAASGPGGLKLQAIFYRPANASAMISGKTVGVGEMIQGHKVVAISPQSVTVETPDKTRKVLTMNVSGK